MGHVEGNDDGIGYGVNGQSDKGKGVTGYSNDGDGVYGGSKNSSGVSANSSFGDGVHATSGTLSGVYGFSDTGNGIYGQSNSGDGVHATSGTLSGVYGFSDTGNGIYGQSNSTYYAGVTGIGVAGGGPGVWGKNDDGFGVIGDSRWYCGVMGRCISGELHDISIGVSGLHHDTGYGVYGASNKGIGIYGKTNTGQFAAVLEGNVNIVGRLHKTAGSFKIDHPLDPANKYLYHSFVESPDMKNVYDGVVTLDDKGEAQIRLPDWFGVLNKDFRYQLTAIGAPGPNLYIAEEIISDATNTNTTKKDSSGNENNKGNSFKIAGGTSGMKVLWQVTGIRKDAWANANRIEVEEDKPDKERGYYIYPELYGQPEEKGISRVLFPKEEEEKLLINK